jgi:hypothetical protein
MKSEFASLPQGFSFDSRGRSGFVHFRERDNVLELYWDISGVKDYDWLFSLEAAKAWAHPKEEKISEAKREEIVDALERWLGLRISAPMLSLPSSAVFPHGKNERRAEPVATANTDICHDPC